MLPEPQASRRFFRVDQNDAADQRSRPHCKSLILKDPLPVGSSGSPLIASNLTDIDRAPDGSSSYFRPMAISPVCHAYMSHVPCSGINMDRPFCAICSAFPKIFNSFRTFLLQSLRRNGISIFRHFFQLRTFCFSRGSSFLARPVLLYGFQIFIFSVFFFVLTSQISSISSPLSHRHSSNASAFLLH